MEKTQRKDNDSVDAKQRKSEAVCDRTVVTVVEQMKLTTPIYMLHT